MRRVEDPCEQLEWPESLPMRRAYVFVAIGRAMGRYKWALFLLILL